MPGISFDRAAGYYDATRGYAEGSAERIRDGIVAHTGAGTTTRFLELGVGTGRIALPFIRAGYDYTGVDISQAMMGRLAAKLAGDEGAAAYRFQLLQADVTELPFADVSFDVIIVVHVLHLIESWQLALQEARRVLRRGGWLLCGGDQALDEDASSDDAGLPAPLRVHRKWRELHRELGLDPPAGRWKLWGKDERLITYLQSLGAKIDIVELAGYERPAISARDMVERLRSRSQSADWGTPDDLHAEAMRRLEEWVRQAIPRPDEPAAVTGNFTAITATWSVAK